MVTSFDKAIVAFIMAALMLSEEIWGVKLGITEEWVTGLIGIVGTILVYLVPNKEA
jgi:hypothetical protein